MFAIAFDLVVEDIVRHYPRSIPAAYAEVRSLLAQHGFEWTQGSVYLSRDCDLTSLTMTMVALRSLEWFPHVVRDIRAFRVELWSDFTAFIKS